MLVDSPRGAGRPLCKLVLGGLMRNLKDTAGAFRGCVTADTGIPPATLAFSCVLQECHFECAISIIFSLRPESFPDTVGECGRNELTIFPIIRPTAIFVQGNQNRLSTFLILPRAGQ